jgi:hypothetical protein
MGIDHLARLQEFLTKECLEEEVAKQGRKLLDAFDQTVNAAVPRLTCSDLDMTSEAIAIECIAQDPATQAAAERLEQFIESIRKRSLRMTFRSLGLIAS